MRYTASDLPRFFEPDVTRENAKLKRILEERDLEIDTLEEINRRKS